MSRFRYTRYVPTPLEEIDLEELLDQLRSFFLQSGFFSQFFDDDEGTGEQSLKQALASILADEKAVPENWRDEMRRFSDDPVRFQLSPDVDRFLDQLIEKLQEDGYLERVEDGIPGSGEGRSEDDRGVQIQFELAEKGVDFLGYRTLRHLIGIRGSAEFGLHETDRLGTGVEANAESRPYEFGDTLNLDAGATLLNAIQREGLGVPLNLEYADLMVHQTEETSSCATVLMLDCSHSMILYGEDRFTPAKGVALALAHLIRTQYPGDSLEVVLFHDSAEQIPLVKLPRVKVGPYHTNTCHGLQLARRILMDQRKEMRQIIMITDGKPSALTLPDGRIYKNAWGLDPLILQKTFEEVAACRKSGILINTFMLARDYHLVDFVKKVSQICQGKAYFTTPTNLANYILLDFMKKKAQVVH